LPLLNIAAIMPKGPKINPIMNPTKPSPLLDPIAAAIIPQINQITTNSMLPPVVLLIGTKLNSLTKRNLPADAAENVSSQIIWFWSWI